MMTNVHSLSDEKWEEMQIHYSPPPPPPPPPPQKKKKT